MCLQLSSDRGRSLSKELNLALITALCRAGRRGFFGGAHRFGSGVSRTRIVLLVNPSFNSFSVCLGWDVDRGCDAEGIRLLPQDQQANGPDSSPQLDGVSPRRSRDRGCTAGGQGLA